MPSSSDSSVCTVVVEYLPCKHKQEVLGSLVEILVEEIYFSFFDDHVGKIELSINKPE